jgi:hypothetical protein
MLPTIYSGDFLVVDHWSHRLGWLKRGDVITAISPTAPDVMISKRLIGMVSFPRHPKLSSIAYSPVILFVQIRLWWRESIFRQVDESIVNRQDCQTLYSIDG